MISDYHINLLLILVVTYFMLFYSYSYSQLLNFPLQCNRDLRCYTNYITINRIFKWLRYWGRHRTVDRSSGAYSGRGGGQGRPPPWVLRILRERALSLTQQQKKRQRGRMLRKKKKYIVSGVMMAKEPPLHFDLFPPSNISLYPFLPFLIRQKTKRYFFNT